MSDFPYIFTFYSYKGGVGRSMALLNTAYALAGRGRNVLVVDADLEAPGISEFLLRRDDEREKPSDQDVLDLVSWAFDTANALGDRIDDGQFELPNAPSLAGYVTAAPAAQLAKVAPRIGWTGRLDFVAANTAGDYFARLEKLNLPGKGRDDLIRAGKVLRQYLKTRRIEVVFPGLEDLYGPEEAPYDYVLVDSRTGLTEAGGLCIGPLADRLVVVTALNEQNVHGTESFLKFVGADVPREQIEDPWDSADVAPSAPEAPPRLGPKPTLVVASPLPPGELEYKKQRVKEVESAIGPVAATLSYHPRMAVMETVFVRDWPGEYLAMEYRALADRMMACVDDHAGQLGQRSQELWSQENRRAEAVEAVVRLTPHNPDLGENLLRQLASKFEPSRDAEFLTVSRLYACLSQPNANDRHVALNNWGNALSDQAETKQGTEAERLFKASCTKCAEAVRIKPDLYEGFNNWGKALLEQARTVHGSEADRLFQDACAKFAEALRIKPDLLETFSNWGDALSDQAKTKQGTEADTLFQDAYAKYAEAVRIKPDYHETLYNWGTALSDQAETKQGPEADRLFQAVYTKYAEAVRIKPDYHQAFHNWAGALSHQARTKQGGEADRLFGAAYTKYAEAVRIKPDLHQAFNNWGAVLLFQARTKQGNEAERLLEEAQARLTRKGELRPGSGSYNLACLSAVRNRPDECRQWLTKARETGHLPSASKVAEDRDLDSVRQAPWFREILEAAKA